jgi:capsule polysaccharide modification protein KpsS
MDTVAGRVFLFLQGPHGPFFHRLATRLAATGAEVRRIAFNPGDEAEWAGAGPLDRYLGSRAAYPGWIAFHLETHHVTDVVLYGDSRPEHARAIEAARSRCILCHCLEEGYLRPHRVTYERWGNNGRSPLLGIALDRMAASVGAVTPPSGGAQDGWGAQGPHLWHSALHHARLLFPSRRYGAYRSWRDLTLWQELALYLGRVVSLPLRRALQASMARWLQASGRGYQPVLLQLSFDTSCRFTPAMAIRLSLSASALTPSPGWCHRGFPGLQIASLRGWARASRPGYPVVLGTGQRRIVYLLDLTKPGGMFLAREFIMRDGDTLYVTSAPFTKWMKILQSVAPLVTFAGSARALSTF